MVDELEVFKAQLWQAFGPVLREATTRDVKEDNACNALRVKALPLRSKQEQTALTE
jgi:hypothetical protein